ncbi:MAG: dehydrogenase [Alphaproteobacteria bacterium PA4]|nr:MAG: dehydrogenase [Alphaproteobacteria bacterium PA4]
MTRTIVMTGATTGIGAAALAHWPAPATRLIVGARKGHVAGAETLPLDLASLTSVRGFADGVIAALGGARIDALVLNAGGQRPDTDARSVDGHELTFATNHLAHYLLLRLLLPQLAPGARIVITSSGTHDPAERTGVPPPRHADARRLADPAGDPTRDANAITAGMRAYSASKLCNLMTALTLAETPDAASNAWIVTAYDPGLTPGTGLARSQMWPVRALIWPLLPLLQPFRPGMNSLAAAGRGLADLATDARPPAGRVYASLRKGVLTWPDPSVLAQDAAARAQLWADSARLTGLA